jgi:nucleoside-diphosphate-sugar epimerase
MLKKILITGANGYIGNCLFHILKNEFNVIGIDKEKSANNKQKKTD